jgi:RimJ/RimL family protein N-acetyltransferase
MDLATFVALVDGDTEAAARLMGLPVPAEFAAQVDIWAFMVTLLSGGPENEHSENEHWVMRAVVHDDVIVGNAGFKGAPDGGRVELGYRISSTHRRRGFAAAAVELLLDRAWAEPAVDTVIATIDPANVASIGVVTKAGFVASGDRIHPRWGRQLVYAHDRPRPAAVPH